MRCRECLGEEFEVVRPPIKDHKKQKDILWAVVALALVGAILTSGKMISTWLFLLHILALGSIACLSIWDKISEKSRRGIAKCVKCGHQFFY